MGQCEEARGVAAEWGLEVGRLQEQQQQSLKSQAEFSKRYEQCAQDLAMSEGLGQKYGAPRRRAQERIRTEVTRDEQSAGRIDELLAKLQFTCDEAKRLEEAKVVPTEGNGRSELEQATDTWGLLRKCRRSLQLRIIYLRVAETELGCPELPWMPTDRVPPPETDASLLEGEPPALDKDEASGKNKPGLDEVFAEVEVSCKKETKELYDSEGMGAALGEGGIPDSLRVWLVESREKLLGPGGHREKAWKRLWDQIARLELILNRKADTGADDKDDEESEDVLGNAATDSSATLLSLGVGAPAACVRAITDASLLYASHCKTSREEKFFKLVRGWEKGREKHERLLRPRLGSPDAADELAELDGLEMARSKEMTESVISFQAALVREVVEQAKCYLDDVGVCSRSLVQLIDSTPYLDVLKVPPGTAIPKKRMTLKRMRKAQRLKQATGQGAEDRSIQRTWHAVPIDQFLAIARSSEDLVPDLALQPATAATQSDTKGAPAAKKGEPVAAPVVEKASLVSNQWAEALSKSSAVKGAVSTAHRSLLSERDAAVARYAQRLAAILDEIRETYGQLLRQESSWLERWARQVTMLRKGGL